MFQQKYPDKRNGYSYRLPLALAILTTAGCMQLTPLSHNQSAASSIIWDPPPASIVIPVIKAEPSQSQSSTTITPAMATQKMPDSTSSNRVTSAPPLIQKAVPDQKPSHAVQPSSPPPTPGAPTPKSGETFQALMALQILLDRANFSPNCIDGVNGSKTRQAFAAWKESQGLASSPEETNSPLDEALGDPHSVFTTYRVSAADYAGLAPVPTTWLGKSHVTTLGYETVREGLAEKFHLKEATLMKLNPDAQWPDPPEGTILKVPDVSYKRLPKAARISISLSTRQLRVYDAQDHLIALFPCSIGKEESKRPVGVLNVMNAARNPEFVFDPAVFIESEEARSITQKLVIPPGPNNPVGIAWIGLNRPGYGMHGTPHPEDIGKTESHGCFRLANWNAQKLLKMVEIGIPVVVLP